MAEQNEEQQSFNIQMTPEVMAGVFSNFANITHDDHGFTITFIRLDHSATSDNNTPGVAVARVNASPRFVEEMIAALSDNFSKWKALGEIRSLPESPDEQ